MITKHFLKLPLGVISIFFAISPIATAISCGGSTKADLYVGIRPEDEKLWKNVVKQFAQATGKKIKIRWVNDQKQNYSAWKGNNLIPDVTIADSSWARNGIKQEYFQKIDIKDIAENSKYKISGVDPEYVEQDIQYNPNTFETAMMKTMELEDKKYAGMPVIYGPKLTYAWKAIPKQDGSLFNLYDGTQKLQWYVPNANAQTLDMVEIYDTTNKNNWEDSPLYSRKNDDHHRLMNTEEDIQEFLSNALNKADLKFNQSLYDESTILIDSTQAQNSVKKVIATGNLGYNQRLASVAHTIYKYVHKNSGQLSSAFEKNKLISGAFMDPAISWPTFAFGNKLIQQTQAKVDEATTNLVANSLDDSKVFARNEESKSSTKWGVYKNSMSNNAKLTHYQVLEYLAHFGYHQNGVFGDSSSMNNDDGQVGFAGLKTLFVGDGALWQWGSLKDTIKDKFHGIKIKDKNNNDRTVTADDVLTSFGQPIQITNVDGYSMAKWISGDRKLLATKFMRFLMQPKAAADITGTKAISTVKAAQALQPHLSGARKNGLDNAGTKGLKKNQVINNIEATLAKSSFYPGENNLAIYDVYNDIWIKGNRLNLDSSNRYFVNLQKFKTTIDYYNAQYQDAIDV